MRWTEYLSFAQSNLREMKLRTVLTAFGVAVGIGALVAMVGFGQGLQKNVAESFAKLDLLNSITVLPEGGLSGPSFGRLDSRSGRGRTASALGPALDEAALRKLEGLKGVEAVFPEIRFPAVVEIDGLEEFRLVQVVPARIAASKLFKLEAGTPFARDDDEAVLVGKSLLRRMNIPDSASALGRKIRISSLALDLGAVSPANLGAIFSGAKLPFSRETYEFTIVGVTENLGFSGPNPLQSDVFIPSDSARRIKKLPFTNVWDLFRGGGSPPGYSAVNVRLSSPAYADSVKADVKAMGFSTFALVDQFEQIKTSFLFMDMALAAVGMIAIFVAALGIVNTMVMSILERYQEIGIMKAVGASPRDIKRIFLVESAAIGLAGGTAGLALGWIVSRLINRVLNFFLAKQGIPFIEYFSFPLWLWLSAVVFAVLVSLVSGLYPARRAARVDPVVALRHE